jgi:predicted nucleic acid-binding Zn ribbon protein
MAQVNCLYCGKPIADDAEHCPHCGAVSHFQKRSSDSRVRRRFVIFFIVVTLFTLIMAFVLPR